MALKIKLPPREVDLEKICKYLSTLTQELVELLELLEEIVKEEQLKIKRNIS